MSEEIRVEKQLPMNTSVRGEGLCNSDNTKKSSESSETDEPFPSIREGNRVHGNLGPRLNSRNGICCGWKRAARKLLRVDRRNIHKCIDMSLLCLSV